MNQFLNKPDQTIFTYKENKQAIIQLTINHNTKNKQIVLLRNHRLDKHPLICITTQAVVLKGGHVKQEKS